MIRNDKAEPTSQTRADWVWIPESQDIGWEETLYHKFEKSPEGFLKGRAVVTNVGVFPYQDASGKIRMELRPPEEVFHPDSIATLSLLPLTLDHPQVPVSSDNAKDLSVGFLGETVNRDAYHLSSPITVTDGKAVEEVESGRKRALSAGYSVELDETPGVWMGVPYDAIQRKIRYNHAAIVERGRAGDAAVMKLDSAGSARFDAVQTSPNNTQNQNPKEDIPMKKIVIDGVEYEAPAQVVVALTKSQAEVQSLSDQQKVDSAKVQEEKSKVQASLDSVTEENTKLKADLKTVTDSIPSKVAESVKARISLVETAIKAGVEVKADASDEDLKKAVILKAFPEAGEKLEKADSAYLTARFDVAVEGLAKVQTTAAASATATAEFVQKNDGKEVSSAKSREDYLNRLKNGHKIPETK